MDLIVDLCGYPLSGDHEALWELAQQQSVVCLADFHWGTNKKPLTDVARTIFNGESVDISARETCYVSGWDKDAFLKQCKAANVRWIIPTQLTTRLKSPELADET